VIVVIINKKQKIHQKIYVPEHKSNAFIIKLAKAQKNNGNTKIYF
jgi:hypothetical protein